MKPGFVSKEDIFWKDEYDKNLPQTKNQVSTCGQAFWLLRNLVLNAQDS